MALKIPRLDCSLARLLWHQEVFNSIKLKMKDMMLSNLLYVRGYQWNCQGQVYSCKWFIDKRMSRDTESPELWNPRPKIFHQWKWEFIFLVVYSFPLIITDYCLFFSFLAVFATVCLMVCICFYKCVITFYNYCVWLIWHALKNCYFLT